MTTTIATETAAVATPDPAPAGSYGWRLVETTETVPETVAVSPVPAQSTPATVARATPVVSTTPAAPPQQLTPKRQPERKPKPRPRPAPAPRAAVLSATVTTSGDAQKSILLLAALFSAIACFSVAVAPAGSIPWRRGAVFVLYRRETFTRLGILCLLAAAVIYVLTR